MSHSSRPPDPYWSDPIPNSMPPPQGYGDGQPPSSVYGGKAGYAPRGTTAYRGRPQPAPVYTTVHPSPKSPYCALHPLRILTNVCRNTTVPHRQPGPPSPSEITSLQSKIASMLTDSSSSSEPTSPRRPPPPANRALYHSPPLRRTNPPPSSPPRQVRSQGHDANLDSCEDITTYALNVVRGLQIPEDERSEKEEFCRELERIVKQIRPSTPFAPLPRSQARLASWRVLTRFRCECRVIWEFCEYFYDCEFRYRLLRYGSRGYIRRPPILWSPRKATSPSRFPGGL
jgi:hypothetical protein